MGATGGAFKIQTAGGFVSVAAEAGQCSLVLVLTDTPRPVTYSLAEAAQLVGVHPELLRHYCRIGLLGEARAQPEADLGFDDDALYAVKRFEHFRRRHGVQRQTLRLIFGLWREVEQLRSEVRFLRGL